MSTVDVTDITARYHGGDEFSTAAFEHTSEQRRVLDRARIERAIREHGPATCQELEDRIGMSHESCSARISEMRKPTAPVRLVTVGTRLTRSGRSARVHALAELVPTVPDRDG